MRDDERHDQMAINYACKAHPAAREFLHHARIADEAQSQASVLDGNRCAEEPEFLHGGDQRMRILVGVFEFRCGRDHIAVHEASAPRRLHLYLRILPSGTTPRSLRTSQVFDLFCGSGDGQQRSIFQKPSDKIAAHIAFFAATIDFDLRRSDEMQSDTTIGCQMRTHFFVETNVSDLRRSRVAIVSGATPQILCLSDINGRFFLSHKTERVYARYCRKLWKLWLGRAVQPNFTRVNPLEQNSNFHDLWTNRSMTSYARRCASLTSARFRGVVRFS